MSWKEPEWLARMPRLVRGFIAAPLVLMLAASLLAWGEEIAAEGLGFALFGLAGSFLLLAAAIRNWPLLWNALGVFLRALVGERGARIIFAVLAVVFMLPCLMRTSVALADFRAQQLVSAPDGEYPLGVVDTSSVEVQLSRGACFGTCPVYTLEIRGDGLVRFEGDEHASILAPVDTVLTRAQLAGLLEAFERVNYAKLGDYSADSCSDRTDSPSATTSLRYDGKEKVVHHYFGCDRAPEALTHLEWAIDSIAGVGARTTARATAG